MPGEASREPARACKGASSLRARGVSGRIGVIVRCTASMRDLRCGRLACPSAGMSRETTREREKEQRT
jgi:hypothetical protein